MRRTEKPSEISGGHHHTQTHKRDLRLKENRRKPNQPLPFTEENYTSCFVIYRLCDPRTNEVRYIGKTNDAWRRYKAHMSSGRGKPATYVGRWIAALHREGVEPRMDIIQRVFSDENALEAERGWIEELRRRGAKLTNLTDGGEGACGHIKTPEQRAAISKRLTGRVARDSQREMMSKKYRILSDAQIEEMKSLRPALSYSKLGKRFGVSMITAHNAVKGLYYGVNKPRINVENK